MAFEQNQNYTAPIDGRARVILPAPLMELAKIKNYVEFELVKEGILLKSFHPQTKEYCSICKNLDTKMLKQIKKDTYVCFDCIATIAKSVGIPCSEE